MAAAQGMLWTRLLGVAGLVPLWNLEATLLDGCGTACVDPNDFMLDAASALMHREPGVRFGMINHQTDPILAMFWEIDAALTTQAQRITRDRLLPHGNVAFYVMAGSGHGIGADDLSSEVDGVQLGSWIDSLIEGEIRQVGADLLADEGDAGLP
jgi:hypothetical protein